MTATTLARAVVDRLLAAGVDHAVVSPGSRNAALALALHSAAEAGLLRLHTRIDERSGAFLALGAAKSSRRPAVVVTTSGTAVANLHPAVLEAAHAGVGLLVVSADRPAHLRGTGASQTTDQVDIFGTAAATVDIAPESHSGRHGDLPPIRADRPGHWNLQFAEPLVPTDTWRPVRPAPAPEPVRVPRFDERPPTAVVDLPIGPRTVVVAGDDAGPPARLLAEAARWPLLAEPTSGARTGDHVIRTYRLLLDGPLADRIERVVVLGHPTLSRPVQRLCSRTDVEVISVRGRGRWPTHPFAVAAEHDAVTAVADDPDWLAEWRAADRALGGRLDRFVAGLPGPSPYDVAAEVSAAVPPGGLLVVGASNPIRDLDLMATTHPARERRLVIANRGLAGIDGTISTAIGAALGRPGGRAIAYVGDLTFLHDLNGLLIGPDEDRPDLTVVVANDDGGSIFATLEQGAERYRGAFEKVFGTPHGADLAALCAGYGMPHRRVASRGDLALALARPPVGIEVVEVAVRRDERRQWDRAIRALATTPTV